MTKLTTHRLPPNGPTNPEIYLVLALMTRHDQGMHLCEDDTGEMVFVSKRSKEIVPLNLDHYEALASRGWVEAVGDRINISSQGLYWLHKYMKGNRMVFDSEVTK